MKKRYFIIIVITCLIVLIFFVMPRGTKPFRDITVSDISSVSVELLPPDVSLELEKADINQLVDILHKVVIYDKDGSYGSYNGQAVIYTITKTDGTQTVVQASNPFFIIDGVGYKTKYGPCEELSKLGNRMMNNAK